MNLRTTFLAFVLLCTSAAAQNHIPTARELNLPSTSPWVVAKPGTPTGLIKELTIPSKILRTQRRVWIYTPPGFDRGRATPYNLMVAFDGATYLDVIPVPTILDNLLAAGKISPTMAVLIDNGSGSMRLNDLANRAPFAAFLSDELIPWARHDWKATRDPQRTIVTGSSAGGLAAAYVAFKRPDLFGNVLAQSGAFWRGNDASNEAPYEWLTEQYKNSAKSPVTFWMEVGGRENSRVLRGAGPVFVEANRRFRDNLLAKGYTVQYSEIEDADHEPGHWRNHLADGVVWLAARWQK